MALVSVLISKSERERDIQILLISHSCKNMYLSIYSDVVKDLLAQVDKKTQQVKLLANKPDNLCSNPGPMRWKESLSHARVSLYTQDTQLS